MEVAKDSGYKLYATANTPFSLLTRLACYQTNKNSDLIRRKILNTGCVLERKDAVISINILRVLILMNEKPNTQFRLTQTMLRIKDPTISIDFYTKILGMTLLDQYDFPDMKFTLYFMGYLEEDDVLPEDSKERSRFIFNHRSAIELTHNWVTENDPDFKGYHDGNTEPKGFGHIGITVPDVYKATDWFEQHGVEFVKKPNDGVMKGLAFIRDPDGYWIEIISADSLVNMVIPNV